MQVAFVNAKATHIFSSKNISVYAKFNDRSFNDTLTKGIFSFEQLGPDDLSMSGKQCGPRSDAALWSRSSLTQGLGFIYKIKFCPVLFW